MVKGIFVFDSFTGNTEKICIAAAASAGFAIFKVDNAPVDLSGYDVMVLGTPNIRAMPSPGMTAYLEKVKPAKAWGLMVTFGVPVWGAISSSLCDVYVKGRLRASRFIASFKCPGYHGKLKTYHARPNLRDLQAAKRFGLRMRVS